MLYQMIMNTFPNKGDGKWNAKGFGGMAVVLGFKPPADDDDSGIWTHPYAGKFHDKDMPVVVQKFLHSYVQRVNYGDLFSTMSRIKQFVQPLIDTLEDDIVGDEHGPPAAVENARLVAARLHEVVRLCKQTLIEEDDSE